MTYDFGTPVSPEVMIALKREIMESLHVALPGTVERFEPERGYMLHCYDIDSAVIGARIEAELTGVKKEI